MNKRRLEKLADHLERGKLGHERFSFAVINGDDNGNQLDVNGCGTCGCAVGELPFVFPSLIGWRDGYPWWRREKTKFGASIGTMKFFDIERDAACHLFAPGWQLTQIYGGKLLGADATRKQVAANIRAFIAKMEGER